MNTEVMSFRVGVKDYRRMLYFNTFSIHRFQWILVFIAWVSSVTLLILDIINVIEPTQIMHLCFLMVAVSAPILIVNLEMRVRKFKNYSDIKDIQQTLILKDDGVNYRHEKSHETGYDSWDDFLAVYDTKNMYILYKDNQHTVPVPKKDIKSDTCQKASKIFSNKLGRRYKNRA